MKGPLHAIRRRRSERPADETHAEHGPAATNESLFRRDAAEQPAEVQPPTTESTAVQEPVPDVPAGQEPVPARPSFRERGRLRRRLRYLRRVRELGFRDLGGLVFDQHKFARVNDELVRGKLAALAAVDRELRALEHVLVDRRPITELREPGISVCPRCGALHGSEARYCPSCGVPVHGALAIAEVGEAVSLSPGEVGPTARPPSIPAPVPRDTAGEPPLSAVPDPESHPALTGVAEQEAAKAQAEPPVTEESEQAKPASDGEQPTRVMQPVEDDTANGAVPQRSAERHEP